MMQPFTADLVEENVAVSKPTVQVSEETVQKTMEETVKATVKQTATETGKETKEILKETVEASPPQELEEGEDVEDAVGAEDVEDVVAREEEEEEEEEEQDVAEDAVEAEDSASSPESSEDLEAIEPKDHRTLWQTVTFHAVVFVWYETQGTSRTEPLFPGPDGNLQVSKPSPRNTEIDCTFSINASPMVKSRSAHTGGMADTMTLFPRILKSMCA